MIVGAATLAEWNLQGYRLRKGPNLADAMRSAFLCSQRLNRNILAQLFFKEGDSFSMSSKKPKVIIRRKRKKIPKVRSRKAWAIVMRNGKIDAITFTCRDLFALEDEHIVRVQVIGIKAKK